MDGVLGSNGGLPFGAPLRDGYRKLSVVLTRPRDCVKPPLTSSVSALLRMVYRRFPQRPSGGRPARIPLQRGPGADPQRDAGDQGVPGPGAFLPPSWFRVSPDCDTFATGWSNIAVRLLTSAPLALDKYDGTRPEDD